MDLESIRTNYLKAPVDISPINYSIIDEGDVIVALNDGSDKTTSDIGSIHKEVNDVDKKTSWIVNISHPERIYSIGNWDALAVLAQYFVLLCAKRVRITSRTHRHLNTIYFFGSEALYNGKFDISLGSSNVEQIIFVSIKNDSWRINVCRLRRTEPGHDGECSYREQTYSYKNTDPISDPNATFTKKFLIAKTNDHGVTITNVPDLETHLGIICNIVWEYSFSRTITKELKNRLYEHKNLKNYYAMDLIFSMCTRNFIDSKIESPKPVMPIPPEQMGKIKELVAASKSFVNNLPTIASLATAGGINTATMISTNIFDLASIMSELAIASESDRSYLEWE
jgi:hypothetical protein